MLIGDSGGAAWRGGAGSGGGVVGWWMFGGSGGSDGLLGWWIGCGFSTGL